MQSGKRGFDSHRDRQFGAVSPNGIFPSRETVLDWMFLRLSLRRNYPGAIKLARSQNGIGEPGQPRGELESCDGLPSTHKV